MIDWIRVNTLKNEVGAEDFGEIIALFLEEVDAKIGSLTNTPNLDTLGEDLHFLKGSAAGLGFVAFVEQCQGGETLCEEGRPEEVDLPTVLACYSASKGMFLQEMNTVLAG